MCVSVCEYALVRVYSMQVCFYSFRIITTALTKTCDSVHRSYTDVVLWCCYVTSDSHMNCCVQPIRGVGVCT